MRGTAGARALRRLVPALALALALTATAAAAGPPSAAPKPPVVMIVFDEFPVDSLLLPDGRIDGRRFPGFAALARHSTWFPNGHTVYDNTRQAVPAILTGELPAASPDPSYLSYPRSVFTMLGRRGWRIHAREEATTICPPHYCPRTREYGNPHYNILHRRRERLEATIRSLGPTRRPTFTFHHSALPHLPWNYLPSGRQRVGFSEGTLRDFGSPAGFGDGYLTQHLRQRHLLQVGFVDREVGRLLRRLKRRGLLDRALVVVIADHGLSFDVGVDDRRGVTARNLQSIAPVPFFIKRPGQRKGNVDSSYARTIDVLPTIADLLGITISPGTDGASVFSREVRSRTGTRMLTRGLGGAIDLPAAEMERRRAASRAAQTAAFGAGPWRRAFAIGPHPGLLGRKLSSIATAVSRSRAAFVVPRKLSRVNPRAASVPTWVAGRIAGGPAGRTRDLAVGVDGRVRAVGRSFHLGGDPVEYFSLTFPETALRRGRNTVALYEVVAGGLSPKLAAVGAAG